MPMENREKLKSATKTLHDTLEITIDAGKLMDALEQKHFNALLYTHYKFIAQLINHSNDELSFVLNEMRAKKEVLEKDLNYFNVFDLAENIPTQPMTFTSDAAFMGWLYVAMGSQMGNRMMYAKLKNNDFFSGEDGLRYLGFRAEDSMSNWKQLIAMINDLDDEAYHQLEQGAINAFKHFKELWLQTKAQLPQSLV